MVNKIDPFRAQRELERWLFNGVSESDYQPRGLPANWRENATRLGTITYNLETGETRYDPVSDEEVSS